MIVNLFKQFHYIRDGVTEPGTGLISNPLPPFPHKLVSTPSIFIKQMLETNTKKWIQNWRT